jgi:phosphoribosyl 1,2-cyclic phosphate phosphodiesterase
MKVTFFGTGTSQGVPVIGCRCDVCTSSDSKDKRLRTSILIEICGKKILIDAGPDFRQQLLRGGIADLDAILLTHEHKDHTGGLDDVRALNYLNRKPVEIYAEKRVLDSIRSEYSYAFADNPYPGVPEMNLNTLDDRTPFKVGDVEIIPLRVFHYRLPVLGFRIGDLAYITDANRIEPSVMQKIHGCTVLVINALRKEAHLSHFTLSQALDVARESGAGQTYLTHISHQMGLHKDVEKELPDNVKLAYDCLTVEIDEFKLTTIVNPNMSYLLKIKDATFKKFQYCVFRDTNWEMSPEENWAITGTNGSGKTTFLEIVEGRLMKTKGELVSVCLLSYSGEFMSLER